MDLALFGMVMLDLCSEATIGVSKSDPHGTVGAHKVVQSGSASFRVLQEFVTKVIASLVRSAFGKLS